ncbi:MAG: hypothetical protein RLZZ227_376 [Pseudomonadota bacterium]
MTLPTPLGTPSRHEAQFIAAARLLMICGLVYHHLFEIPGSDHSPRNNLENAAHFYPEFINAFFHMAFMAAVPVLSIISGYLFFCRPRLDYRAMLARRFFSVALPTWLWSALWLAIGFAFYRMAGDSGRFAWAAYDFDDSSVMTLLNGVFGITRQPFAFQFWFVHDLLLTLLLTPLIHVLLRYLGWRLLAAGSVVWLLIPDPPLFFSGNVPMFFTLGAYLAQPRSPGLTRSLEQLRVYRTPLLLLFGGALFVRVMSHLAGPLELALHSHQFLCLLRILGVLAIAALLYDMVLTQTALTLRIERYSGCAFFMFAMHYPLIELLQELVVLIPGHATSVGLLLSWLLVPALTIVITLASALACERHLPALFRVLNGGRHTAAVYSTVATPRGTAQFAATGVQP